MEFVDGLLKFFGRKNEPVSNLPQEEGRTPEKWDYQYFRTYLLAAARGQDFLLPIYRYPEQIQLNGIWHDSLNQLGKIGQSMLEGYDFVGIEDYKQVIILPARPAIGEKYHVPYAVVQSQKEGARKKAGIEKFIGDLHSHPARLYWEYGTQRGKFTGIEANLSVGDLYFLVSKDPDIVKGVVEGEQNMFAFRTRATASSSLDYLGADKVTQETFTTYWCNSFGIGVRRGGNGDYYLSKVNGGVMAPLDLLNMNKAIAQTHSLALYKGEKDKDLVRIFPSI